MLEVGITSKGNIAEAGGIEFLTTEVGGELGVLVDVVGEGVVLNMWRKMAIGEFLSATMPDAE